MEEVPTRKGRLMSKTFERHNSNREKTCRLCDGKIAESEDCISLKHVRFGSDCRDLYFHDDCFFRSLVKVCPDISERGV